MQITLSRFFMMYMLQSAIGIILIIQQKQSNIDIYF